jgi:hypothetical protein
MSYRRRSRYNPDYDRGYDYTPVNRSGNTIPAQPVRYADTDFKSIAEARWAVFFDALEVPWLYEPRRFFTSRGGYVPDFYLPAWNVWWEVKGAPPIQAAVNAAASVVGQTRQALCIAWGQMAARGAGPIWVVTGYDSGFHAAIAQCQTCDEFSLIPPGEFDQGEHAFDALRPSILSAYAKARGARWQTS